MYLTPRELILNHPCFTSLKPDEVDKLVALLIEKRFYAGERIVEEGDIVDSVYFIAAGTVEVCHENKSENDSVERTPIATLMRGQAIGLSETGFYSTTGLRTATVVAITDTVSYRLDLNAFNELCEQLPHINLAMRQQSEMLLRMNLIKRAIPFSRIKADKLSWLAEQVSEVTLPAGHIIFKQGDIGDYCYLIRSGKVEILLPGYEQDSTRIRVLKSLDVFGETSILLDTTRNASAKTQTDVTLLAIDRTTLKNITQADSEIKTSLISLIKTRSRPKQVAGIELHEQQMEDGQTAITLKNPQLNRYYRLSEEGFFIWKLLDGLHTLRDISLAFFNQYHVFEPNTISDLIADMMEDGFVEKIVDDEVEEADMQWYQKIDATIRHYMEVQWEFTNCDHWLEKSYQRFIHYLFAWPMQLIFILIALSGVIGFAMTFSHQAEVMHATKHTGWLLILAIILMMVVSPLHELAHAYTTKYFGKKVNSFGIGWFWLSLTAYCDTSDMWLAPNRERLAVDLSGIYVDLIIAGGSSTLLLLVANPYLSVFLWLFSLVLYFNVLMNCNPTVESDGYYVLMDCMKKDELRQKATNWLANHFKEIIRSPFSIRRYPAEAFYWAWVSLYFILNFIVMMAITSYLLYGLFDIINIWLTLGVPLAITLVLAINVYLEVKESR